MPIYRVSIFLVSAYILNIKQFNIYLSNEGASNAAKLLGNIIIRREQRDTPKEYHVSETSIVTDVNKDFHNVDNVSIKGSKIPGTYIFKSTDSTTKNSIIEFGFKASKKQTSQYVSTYLLHSSFEVNGFEYVDDYCELQTHESLRSTSNVQFNTLFDRIE